MKKLAKFRKPHSKLLAVDPQVLINKQKVASPSLVTEKIKGLKVWDAMQITNVDIAKELSLPPVKLHCSSIDLIDVVLAEDAIKSAVNDWTSKRAQRKLHLAA